jgi:molybdopterin converting factor small subunit
VTVRLVAPFAITGQGGAGRRQRARRWSSLVTDFPELSAYEKSISCAVNADYSRFTAAVSDGDEIAFLPPVSGG